MAEQMQFYQLLNSFVSTLSTNELEVRIEAECIELMGTGCLSDEAVAAVVSVVDQLLVQAGEDWDDGNEEHEYGYGPALASAGGVLAALFTAKREAFLPHLDALLPRLEPFLPFPPFPRPGPDYQPSFWKFRDVTEYRGELTWLPVADTTKAPLVYGLLCELAARGHAALSAPAAPPRVLALLAEAFLRGAVPADNTVHAEMVSLLRQILGNPELFHSCLLQLSDEQKQALLALSP